MSRFATQMRFWLGLMLKTEGFGHHVGVWQWRYMTWTKRVTRYFDPKNLVSARLAKRAGCMRNGTARMLENKDTAYRIATPSALKNSQMAAGIALENARYTVPQFKPEGWALD